MSKILFQDRDKEIVETINHNEKIAEIKESVENFLSEISKTNRRLFTYQEIEDILLDIYNLTKK